MFSLAPAKLALTVNNVFGGKAKLADFLPYPLESIQPKSEAEQADSNSWGLEVIRRLAKESKLPTFVLAVFAKEIENG